MSLYNNILFKNKKEKIEILFNKIINNNELNLENKRDKLKELLENEDNTNEQIILEYLKIEKHLNEKNEKNKENLKNFKNLLKKYEFTIKRELFNINFKDFLFKEKSSLENFFSFIKLICDYSEQKDFEKKINIIDNIFSYNIRNYSVLNPIDYKYNIELYINVLHFNFYENIYHSFNINEIYKNDDKNKIEQNIKIRKTGLLFNYNNIIDNEINNIEKQLKYINYVYGTFNNFLLNLSKFLNAVYEKFKYRFFNNNFKDESDILLFSDFLFFLSNFQFDNFNEKYIYIWNDSFFDFSYEEKIKIAENNSNNKFKFQINEHKLYFEKKYPIKTNFIINNIDDYSIEPLIEYLRTQTNKPKKFKLDEFLKIDKYSEKIYIKTIWNDWRNFLLKIYSSQIAISLFTSIFYDKQKDSYMNHHYFINKEEIELIIDNIRYFIFDSDYFAMVQSKTLAVYMYGGNFNLKTDNLSKLAYLSFNVKNHFHEIIGHLNIRFHYYYYYNKGFDYKSPKPKNPSSYAIGRNGIDSGEFIEEQLFGENSNNMSLSQMLYILDEKNYEKKIDTFSKEYKWCKKNIYKVSKECNDFLYNLGINIEEINVNYYNENYTFTQRSKYLNTYIFTYHHLCNYRELDDIYNQNIS